MWTIIFYLHEIYTSQFEEMENLSDEYFYFAFHSDTIRALTSLISEAEAFL